MSLQYMRHTLHVLVPGLFGPLPSVTEIAPDQRWLTLEKRLHGARVDRAAGIDYESTLMGLFGLPTTGGLATAPLRRLADNSPADSQFWLQLNPIFLRADQDRLLVFSSEDFDFSQQESEALAETFASHFSDEGWVPELSNAHRWYLPLSSDPCFTSAEFHQVLGRNMDPFLPAGEGAIKWHGILNEVQMLFFNAPVNEQRESTGLAPINGLWFSGGGYLPESVDTPFSLIACQETLANGLAKFADIEHVNGIDIDHLSLDKGEGVLVYEHLQAPVHHADPYRWIDAISDFERWLEDLISRAGSQSMDVQIYPCDGRRLGLKQKRSWQFWQKPASLISQLAKNPFPPHSD